MANHFDTPVSLARRLDAAQGRIPCDLVIKNVEYLNVFTGEWLRGDLAVHEGTIIGVEPGLRGRRTHDGRGKRLVPGFIDAHVHVESSLLLPGQFEAVVLPRGTTSALCDPHELANVAGVAGIEYFLAASEKLSLDLWVMLSSCVPATHLETNGGGTIEASELARLAPHPRVRGLAEVMNVPGVLGGDPAILDKLLAVGARESASRIDGHAPLLRGQALSAYASVGIASCHESSGLDEAREKLEKGLAVWIREGSVAKDLAALAPLLTLSTSTSLGFCTDDRNPLDILEEGHIDHLVRESIRRGVDERVAYRAASWSVARHYGLDRGARRTGAIAPGYQADLVLLGDSRSCAIETVWKSGVLCEELPKPVMTEDLRLGWGKSVRARVPEESDLLGPSGPVHVIGIQEGKILTEHLVLPHDAQGVARLSVLERYGRGSAPANGYVRGFGESFRGAIASSVGHDSHNLIVVGSSTQEMRVALAALIECGGGFCVVKEGQVCSLLALPLGGLMSAEEPQALRTQLLELKRASRAIGCGLNEPFLQLAFLSLPVIPSLKLTDRGLVDVEEFRFIDVRAS